MNDMVIKDMIKNGKVSYCVDDEVIVFKRKPNGHPRSLKDGVSYFIKKVELDGHLIISEKSGDGNGWLQPIKVHKMYMINKSILRDVKINLLLNETK
jgi:hypothetical protein